MINLKFTSKAKKPYRLDVDGCDKTKIYNVQWAKVSIDKESKTYEEALKETEDYIETVKNDKNYDVAFVHGNSFNYFRYEFQVAFCTEVKKEGE